MDLWVRLGVNLPLDHFVRELCGDLDVVVDEDPHTPVPLRLKAPTLHIYQGFPGEEAPRQCV